MVTATCRSLPPLLKCEISTRDVLRHAPHWSYDEVCLNSIPKLLYGSLLMKSEDTILKQWNYSCAESQHRGDYRVILRWRPKACVTSVLWETTRPKNFIISNPKPSWKQNTRYLPLSPAKSWQRHISITTLKYHRTTRRYVVRADGKTSCHQDRFRVMAGPWQGMILGSHSSSSSFKRKTLQYYKSIPSTYGRINKSEKKWKHTENTICMIPKL